MCKTDEETALEGSLKLTKSDKRKTSAQTNPFLVKSPHFIRRLGNAKKKQKRRKKRRADLWLGILVNNFYRQIPLLFNRSNCFQLVAFAAPHKYVQTLYLHFTRQLRVQTKWGIIFEEFYTALPFTSLHRISHSWRFRIHSLDSIRIHFRRLQKLFLPPHSSSLTLEFEI